MGPGVLSEVLKKLPRTADPRLMVGFDTSDDACVYRLSDELALIQTVDFFPPVVDDPYLYGQIAAANALSDVYAMGGEPRLALNLLCFPACMDLETVGLILEGGYSKVNEAGAIIAGGHSIDDPEPKYGLCVSGFVHPDRLWTNAGAKPGDVLVLTKPLGSGITNTAAKADMIDHEAFLPSLEVMAQLNKYARDAAAEIGINACTDITGFGLAGHSLELAAASGVHITLYTKELPLLHGVEELARMGIIPGGAYRNLDYISPDMEVTPGVERYLLDIICDPQTSGGLLLCLPEGSADALLQKLKPVAPYSRIVGRVVASGAKRLRVE